jgi:hypothetical protein
MRRIKLMADYFSFALWDEDAVLNFNPDELPLSDRLLVRLHSWEDSFDKTYNASDPSNSGFSSAVEARAFDDEGMKLFASLIDELGDSFSVRYFSQLKRGFIDVPSR